MSNGAEIEANALLASLMAGEDLTIPTFDLTDIQFDLPSGTTNPIYSEIEKLTVANLTEKQVDGAGAFDALMMGVRVHLKEEFDKNRITGAEYAKAYIALTQAAISGSVQYLLGKDQAYWSAVQGQIAAITGKIQMKIAVTELALAQYKARAMKAEYALTKLKLATEDKQFGLIGKQTLLVAEQLETARAATSDYRTDNTLVEGSIGKQKDLYEQQIQSYKRDSEYKATKIFTDVWSTIFTVSEGVPATEFSNASIDAILTKLKTTNNLV